METSHTPADRLRKPLRLWPGVSIAAFCVLFRLLVPLVAPDESVWGVFVGVIGAALVLLWWLLFSRAPWVERFGAIVATVAAYFAVRPLVDPSISGGLMGRMFAVYAMPAVVPPAFVAWAVVTRNHSNALRRVTMVLTIFLACSVWTLLRTEGVMGGSVAMLHWRWTPTPEDRLLAKGEEASAPAPAQAEATAQKEVPRAVEPSEAPAKIAPAPTVAAPTAATPTTSASPDASLARTITRTEWSGFRGNDRDGVVRGVHIETDWSKSPPSELWRRSIGPGWSSFAVDGDRIYTQEQRGDEEMVSCYRFATGEPVWKHRDKVRFYESNGGAGPRATPTLHNGRVYALGATGILNALDARNGAVLWSRNAAKDTGAPLPGWGFTGSPLVVGDALVAATSGRLAGYDVENGNLRWVQKTGGGGYSSPQFAVIGGVPQVVLLNSAGATSVAPTDGAILWNHPWEGSAAILQPALGVDGGLLVSAGDMMGGLGIRRLAVTHAASQWRVEERWTSRGLKPYFNDYVVHKGHAYGFDGSILSCIDVNDGNRQWKGGRYGQGQLVLLPDQDVLLVLSEEGEVALVRATPEQFTELARFKAIEGKTWNHPVVVRDVLLVRNGEEMAAFRLRPAREGTMPD
jgi:outer membrane protein assembly factor BamB